MSDPLKLIAIVGMPGSGKSVAADYFRSQGVPVLRFGDQTEIGLKELKLAINEKNEREYRENIRKELGMAAMAIKIEPRIRATASDHRTIALDGLYSWEEYVYLKGKFPQLILLAIFAIPSIRYARLKARLVRPLTGSEAQSRDVAEIEHLNKGGPIAMADYLIRNEGNREAYKKELELFYQAIR
jgi:dephospho-CoA kinase